MIASVSQASYEPARCFGLANLSNFLIRSAILSACCRGAGDMFSLVVWAIEGIEVAPLLPHLAAQNAKLWFIHKYLKAVTAITRHGGQVEESPHFLSSRTLNCKAKSHSEVLGTVSWEKLTTS
jgi:hypothetical protein